MAASFTPLQPTLGIEHCDLRLVCSCLAMETHIMKHPMNSYRSDVAFRGSLELGSECCNRGQTIFYMLQHSVVPFFPLHNNSTYSWPGQLYQGRHLTNWLVGKVASYDGAMLKVTELFSKGHSTANVCLWRLHGCVLNCIHLSATSVAEIAESTHLNWCPHTLDILCVYIVICHQVCYNSMLIVW